MPLTVPPFPVGVHLSPASHSGWRKGEKGREGGREGEREGGSEGGREGGKGRKERERGREGGKEGKEREGGREEFFKGFAGLIATYQKVVDVLVERDNLLSLLTVLFHHLVKHEVGLD